MKARKLNMDPVYVFDRTSSDHPDQRQKWEASMSKKLNAEDTAAAYERREKMAHEQEDPLMETGAGRMDATIPGSPGGLLDDTMGPMTQTMGYEAPSLDLERCPSGACFVVWCVTRCVSRMAALFEGARANDLALEERQLKVEPPP